MSQQKGYRLLPEKTLPFTRPFLFASQLGFASVLPHALSISLSPSLPDKAVLIVSTPKPALPRGQPAENNPPLPPGLFWTINCFLGAFIFILKGEIRGKKTFSKRCWPRAWRKKRPCKSFYKNTTHTQRTTSGFRTSAPCACVSLLEIFCMPCKTDSWSNFFYFCNKNKSWKTISTKSAARREEENQPTRPTALL